MTRDSRSPDEKLTDAHHDLIVTMQAAHIEWQHGRGADAAMEWIQNTLDGREFIPDCSAPYGREAQMWMNEHRARPYPRCYCGRPSHMQWKSYGACSPEHMRRVRVADAAEPE